MKIRCFQNFECTSQTWFVSRSPMVILFVLSHPFPSPRSWLWLLQLPSPRPPRPPRRALRTAATPCDCWRRRTAESDAGEVMSCLARFNDPKKDPIILIANDFGIQMEDRIMQNHGKISFLAWGVLQKRIPEITWVWRRVVQFDRFRISALEFPLFMNRCWVVFRVIARTLSCPSVDCGQFARSRHRGPRCQVNCLDASTPHESPEKNWQVDDCHTCHTDSIPFKSQVSVEHSVLDGHWIALESFEPLNWQENSSKLDVFQQLFRSNYPSNIMDTIMESMKLWIFLQHTV